MMYAIFLYLGSLQWFYVTFILGFSKFYYLVHILKYFASVFLLTHIRSNTVRLTLNADNAREYSNCNHGFFFLFPF